MKTRTLLLLTAILILTLIFSALAPQAAVLGDVDGDGALTITDATLIQRHLAALTELSEDAVKAGMVSGGASLTITDATLIQRKLAALIAVFPVEETAATAPSPTDAPTSAPTEPPIQPPTEKETVTKVNDTITIYFTNNQNWQTVNAYVYNSAAGSSMSAWPGSAMRYFTQNAYGEKIYSASFDVSKYDRIIFNSGNGGVQTTDTPLTKSSSGYFILSSYGSKLVCGVYPYGQSDEGSVETFYLEYSSGYNKKITVWLPAGYDRNDSSKRYSVLYMTDGQNLFGDVAGDPNCSQNEWECDETVLSLMQNGGDGVIVVGIDNANSKRDSELTPNIGPLADDPLVTSSFKNGTGAAFSDFVVEKVIPAVESRYHVSAVRGVAGSSSGGIEAFYIGMEHMDLFDYVGALSPAFILYSESTWNAYLSSLDFSGDVPRVYIYNGNASDGVENSLYPNAVKMQGWLEKAGYPSGKIITKTDAEAAHNERFWALYFPEALSFGLDL